MNAVTVDIKLSDRKVGDELVKTCNGRNLHAELGIGKDYTNWAKAQIKRGRFVENRDYVVLAQKGVNLSGGRPTSEYHFTIDAGKHIGMMSNTDRGFEVREYFLACERAAKGLAPVARIAYAVSATDTLTKAEQDELRSTLANGAQALPLKQRGAFLQQGWSKLKAHFKVSYREIPRSEFNEALSIASRHAAEATIAALPAPTNDQSLKQALDSMRLMAGSVADLAAAMVNLTHERKAEARGSPPRRPTKGEAETLGPVSASMKTKPARQGNSHVE